MSGLVGECRKAAIRLGRDESGVALMLTLSVILLLYILCCGVYSIGETIREKVEMQNACDSAAYSAAVVQADGLSRIAMINRALSWTYVQLTNVQMDYITFKWLEKVESRFKEDRDNVKKKNEDNSSFWGSCHPGEWCSSSCKDHFVGKDKGWFCGVAPYGSDYVRLNGHLVPISEISSTVSSLAPVMSGHPRLIGQLKQVIAVLNGVQPLLAKQMADSTMDTAQAVLFANLPRRGGAVDLDAAKDFLYFVHTPSAGSPYLDEPSIFEPLYNTEADERIFLTMADGRVHDTLPEYFGVKDTGDKIQSGGLDQWFIRSFAEETYDSDRVMIPPTWRSYHDKGICRVYKNANREEGGGSRRKWRQHHSTVFGLTGGDEPSCVNDRNLFNEQCETVAKSVALYADYEWAGAEMHCLCGWEVDLSGYKEWHGRWGSLADSCKHLMKNDNGGKSHSRRDYWNNSCIVSSIARNTHLITLFIPSCDAIAAAYPILLRTAPYGFARIYGDDWEIYSNNREAFVGESAQPWILGERFYAGDGTIAVGLARRQRNPWGRLLNAAMGKDTATADGLYSLFDPVKEDNRLVAFSAARAAHHFHPPADSAAYGVTEQRPRVYETRYDGVCHNEIGDTVFNINGAAALVEYGVGCVCRDYNNENRLARCWNLCETDWDATILPLRFGFAGSGRYDSAKKGNVLWDSDVENTFSLIHNVLLRSRTGSQDDPDMWMPFVDSSGRIIENVQGNSLHQSGAFLASASPPVAWGQSPAVGVVEWRQDDSGRIDDDWWKAGRTSGWDLKSAGELDLPEAIKRRIL